MLLHETLAAIGMTPPANLAPGRWLRFPGVGKSRSNRSGWCRIISPTLAIYGDWSSNLSAVWKDETHRDDKESARQLEEARKREREFARAQRVRQEEVAKQAQSLVRKAQLDTHPYLVRKGFPSVKGLIYGAQLAIPMRDASRYLEPVLNVQLISPDGTKRFLTGGRAGGAVYILGPPHSRYTMLCEGYATGLTLEAAVKMLPGPTRIVVCFSAMNLERVASLYSGAVVAADNDQSGTGEHAAQATGLKWTMPYEVGTDFNDLHQAMGLHAVVERMRELLMR
jgi:putative DNA primase/helicase